MDNHLGGDAGRGMLFDPCIWTRPFEDSWSGVLGHDEPREFESPSFAIRAANSSGERSSASVLIGRMYATRGYASTPLPDEQHPNLVTLVATDHQATIGTLTVGFDSDDGLMADDLFADEVEQRRAAGRKICEFTKLAIDSGAQSKLVLAALFNVAYLYAHRLRGVDDLMIEVNPRHARFYQSMLGFKVVGPRRMNRRVNAPAVLLLLEFSQAREKMMQYDDQADMGSAERSRYLYSFSRKEETAILDRLRRRFGEETRPWSLSADDRSSTEATAWIPAPGSRAIHCV